MHACVHILMTFFILLRFLHFQLIAEEKYEVTASIRDASIVIKNSKEPPLTLTIHLTSPVVREEAEKQAAGGRSSPGVEVVL